MFKKFNLVTLCTIIPFTLASCSNANRGNNKLLKRKTYDHEVNVLTGEISNALDNAFIAQVDSLDSGLTTYFDIPNSGTIVENIDIAANVQSFRLIEDEFTAPIEFNNLIGDINDKITTSWDISNGYMKFIDSLGGVNYVIKDADNSYWNCFPNKVIGEQFRINITDYIRRLGGGSLQNGFKNYVVIQSAKNLGYFQDDDFNPETESAKENMIRGIGLDMTGFGGYNLNLSRTADRAKIQYGLKSKGAPKTILDNYSAIDYYINIIDQALKDNLGASLIHQYTNDSNNPGNLSLECGFNELDFNKLTDILNKYLGIFFSQLYEASGSGALNYFISFEQNFIHQQEVVIHFKDMDFAIYPTEPSVDTILLDIKKANIDGVINEEINFKPCDIDQIDLGEFTPIATTI